MKTERRHQLQKNVLAERLGKVINQISPYTRWMAWGALIAALALLATTVWYYLKSQDAAVAWQEYIDAMANPNRQSALEDLAANRPNEAVGVWAQLAVADGDLRTGSQVVYENREEAEHSIKDAIARYKEVLDASSNSTFLKQRAEYGCAQGHEMLGELSAARKHYEQVVDVGKDTALGKQAAAQLKLLKDKDVRQFYDWFIAQRPAPSTPDGFGLPNLNNLPDTPDFNFNELLGTPPATNSTKSGDEGSSPEGSTPADGESETTPEGDTPQSTAPETTSEITPETTSETTPETTSETTPETTPNTSDTSPPPQP